jgi:hypothetical protein
VESARFPILCSDNALSMASVRVVTPPADCQPWCLCFRAHRAQALELIIHPCDCRSGYGSCSPRYFQSPEPLQSWRPLLEAMRRVSARWRVPTCQSGTAASRERPGKTRPSTWRVLGMGLSKSPPSPRLRGSGNRTRRSLIPHTRSTRGKDALIG